MRVVGYLRVSTERQAEEGLGLEVQEQAIRAWARQHTHQLVGFHRDEGVSGSNGLEDRMGLAEALAELRAKRAAGVVVYRLDRLARDLVLQEQLLREVRSLDGELFTTSAAEAGYLADDPDDPSRRLIRQVLGAVAEYEKGMIALRLRMGRRLKAERGGYAYGSPAYGWASVDGVLTPVDAEQAVISRIRALHAARASLREITRVLNDGGVPARRGGRWHSQMISRILSRS